jgi:uncharacterized protein with beta-barrel porin domain
MKDDSFLFTHRQSHREDTLSAKHLDRTTISRNARLGIIYSGQFGRGNTENVGSVNLRWKF